MSHVITTTLRQKQTAMVDSPMHLDPSPTDVNLRPIRTSPEIRDERALAVAKSNSTDAAGKIGGKRGIDLRINTAGRPESTSESHQLCMCTPPHHVPRPCNSFILYRTRMASQAISENPGASNPQISKILGDRWAKESEEVKAKWKKLAEEESKRHRQQYPDYRFQPKRRGSKSSTPSSRSSLTEDNAERCPKCNGLRPSQTPGLGSHSKSEPGTHQTPLKAEHVHQGRRADDDGYGPESPELKRRRLTNAAGSRGVAPIDVAGYDRRYHGYGGYSGHTPSSAGYDGQGKYYRQSGTPLPQPGDVGRQYHHVSMPPPPRPAATWDGPAYPYPPSARSGHRDESVRLPPLKTAITPAASPAHDLDSRYNYIPTPVTGLGITSAVDSPGKTTHEQIMSISFSRKMAVVGKICPPLPRSGLHGLRGAIIAVEGPHRDTLHYVSRVVEKSLQVCQDICVQSWSNDKGLGEPSSSKDAGVELRDMIPTIFDNIKEWHQKSKEMIHFAYNGPDSEPDSTMVSPAASGPSKEEDDGVSVASSGTGASSGSYGRSSKTSVALVKNGYSLATSDHFACVTSHSLNNYGPVDHWQWMATLWRGIVGPDLVVYVKPCPAEDIEKLKTVEFQKQLGVMIVRVPIGKSLDEATERRLNFEVIEWITDVWPKGASHA